MTNQGKNAIDTLLAESFKEIASVKPIEKITIKEITDKAGVIRPTFYNHFQDKYELLEWIVRRELMDGVREGIASGKFRDSIVEALTKMTEEKSFYTNADKLVGQNSFKEILFAAVKDMIASYLDADLFKKHMPYPWLTPDVAASFISASVCYAVTTWIETGMKIPVGELVDTFIYMSYHSTLELINPEG